MKVRFCSPIRSYMGYAELGRIVVNQLLQSGADVTVVEIPVQVSQADFGPLGDQALALVGNCASADVNVVNMLPRFFAQYRLPGARNIGFSMFETDRLPDDWVRDCNVMDAMWVPSEWVREMFIASGVTVPVFVVGVDAAPVAVSRPPTQPPFRLLSMFEWSARKNPVGLLRAYCAAFDGDSDTVLTLKVARHPDPKQSLAFVQNAISGCLSAVKPARKLPRIEIVTQMLSTAQVALLHADSHAYVSLAHAEGWGLPAWDATLAGKPVIHTGWSAPVEFVHPQGQVRCNLTPVYGMEEFVPFYHMGMNWAEPHLDDAIARLRDLRENYDCWLETSLAHRSAINERYSLARRVEQLRLALRAGS